MDSKEENIKLGALHYPSQDQFGNPIDFDTLFIPYIYSEIYFEGVYKDILNDRNDLVIVDVGANIGITVQHFRNHAKIVYAIEPSPENYAALKANVEYNGWDNVKLCNYALADKNGEAEFRVSHKNRTTNGLVQNKEGNPNWWVDQTFKVPTKSIDTFFEENNIEHVDFMKFDPEDAEDLILRSEGFKKVYEKIDAIECEFHNENFGELVKFLQDLGFKARMYESAAVIVLFTR